MNNKKVYSNIAIALIFFIVGIGIGGIIGVSNGYNHGYRQGVAFKELHPDTIKVYDFMASPDRLKTEYGYE